MAAPFLLTLTATGGLLAALIALGRLLPHYSHVRHTISELGESGGRFERLVGWGIFFPAGLLLLFTALLIPPSLESGPALQLLAASLAVGYGVAALFPCDPGSPSGGSWRQQLHNLGGAAEYVGGALALLWLAESLGPVYRYLGLMVAGAMLSLGFPYPWRGLVQRIAEACLFGGLLVGLSALR